TKQIARTEEMIARMEKLAAETTVQLDSTTKAKDELTRDAPRVKKEPKTLNESIRGHVEKLALEKKEFEAYDLRLKTLQTSVGEAEARMDALAVRDKNVTQLNQRVDTMAKRYQELFTQSDELNKKQEALESLQSRLEQVDE